MILRGLRRIKIEPYSASPSMSLLPPLMQTCVRLFASSGRQSELEDTAEAVAKALLEAGEQMLTGPPAAEEAETLALHGAGPAVLVTHLVVEALYAAAVTFVNLR